MFILQQLWYRLNHLDKKKEQSKVANLNKTEIQGVTFDDELMKRYLYHKHLDKFKDD